jgi:uncharacterized protein YlxW (UPF0749 family)
VDAEQDTAGADVGQAGGQGQAAAGTGRSDADASDTTRHSGRDAATEPAGGVREPGRTDAGPGGGTPRLVRDERDGTSRADSDAAGNADGAGPGGGTARLPGSAPAGAGGGTGAGGGMAGPAGSARDAGAGAADSAGGRTGAAEQADGAREAGRGGQTGDAAVELGETAGGETGGRRRWVSRAAVLIGVLCGLLGFGLAVQVRSNTASNGLASARQEDLVRILDDLSSREERLRRQIASLEAARSRLTTTGDRNSAALVEARSRSAALGVLAGTVAAQGPGIQLTMSDPQRRLKAEDLLDAVEELRAAGAEAIQVGPVRIGLDSSFTDAETTESAAAPAGILADGQLLTGPYQLLAIGDPPTLATALNIPGGVVDTVRQAGGRATITQQQRLVIHALRTLSTPHYAQPAE